MGLFDEIERIDKGPAAQAEPNFAYLNRTARHPFSKSRALLESWFERYPTSEKPEFMGRFRSPLNEQHKGALLELFLHQLLLKLGCQVELHPSVRSETEKRPDFLVELPDGNQMFLEARLATGDSSARRAIDARLNDFYDSLNKLDSPDYFLAIEAHDFEPKTPLPGKKIRGLVQHWLQTLDYDEIRAVLESNPIRDLPSFEYRHDGKQLKFVALPKYKMRGVSGIRPIGIFPSRVGWGGAVEDIRDAIEVKASRYKKLDLPYIIAVHAYNPLGGRGDEEVALFGNDYSREASSLEIARFTSKSHGVWTSPVGPKHTRVSAVLIVRELYPHTFKPTTAYLYHNPWASKPLPNKFRFSRLGCVIMQAGGLHYDQSESIISILDLPEDWPGDDDMID